MILKKIGLSDEENRKHLISMCLFGKSPSIYTKGAIQNAKLRDKIYPDFKIRFYVDENVDETIVSQLLEEKAEVFIYRSLPGRAGQLMRFLPLAGDDDDDDRVTIVRDCDSRINLREKVAVSEFLKSGKRFHLMYEHMHPKNTIFGGMFGVRGGIPKLCEKIQKSLRSCEKYGDDMVFLDRVLLPMMNDLNTMKHGEAGHSDKYDDTLLPYRDKVYHGYVGQVILCNCPFEMYVSKGCDHATRKVPCSVATLVHSSPKVLFNLSKFLG